MLLLLLLFCLFVRFSQFICSFVWSVIVYYMSICLEVKTRNNPLALYIRFGVDLIYLKQSKTDNLLQDTCNRLN